MGFATLRWLVCFLFACALCAPVTAQGSHDRTQFGHDITIGANDNATEVTCFGCSVRIRGRVSSDVTTFAGSVVIEEGGEVGGDTTTFGGDVRLDSGAKVNDVTVFGGKVRRDPSAAVAGDITNFGGAFWVVLIFGLPFVLFGCFVALIVWVVRRLLRPAVPLAA
jgi:hypothetical protein